MDIQVLASSSSGNCYRISDGKTALLLDAGISIKEIRQKLAFRLHEIDACLVTHEHGDHAKAVPDLVKAGVEVCASMGTAAALENDLSLLTKVKALQQFRVNTFDILPFDVQHDAAEPLGFLIYSTETKEKLLFATDTYYVKYTGFKGVNYYMVECNYAKDILDRNYENKLIEASFRNRLIKSHFSLENVKKFFEANDLNACREIYLMHLSAANSDTDRFKREIQELTGVPVTIC